MSDNSRLATYNIAFKPAKTLLTFLALSLAVHFLVLTAQAQRRDHLTEQEAELVREAQEIDLRTDVFVKAIERRVMILNNRATELKDVEKWGAPKGTKAQLLYDISKILQEAIDNIENVAARDANSKLFPKAMKNLTEASRKLLPQLETYKNQSADKMEQAAILTSIDYCNQIIEASTKVKEPPPEEKKKKSSKDNQNKNDSTKDN